MTKFQIFEILSPVIVVAVMWIQGQAELRSMAEDQNISMPNRQIIWTVAKQAFLSGAAIAGAAIAFSVALGNNSKIPFLVKQAFERVVG